MYRTVSSVAEQDSDRCPGSAQVVAALAACSLVFAEIDPTFSKTLVDQAAALYVEVSTATNLGRYSNIELTGCRTASDPIDVRALCPDGACSQKATLRNVKPCFICRLRMTCTGCSCAFPSVMSGCIVSCLLHGSRMSLPRRVPLAHSSAVLSVSALRHTSSLRHCHDDALYGAKRAALTFPISMRWS